MRFLNSVSNLSLNHNQQGVNLTRLQFLKLRNCFMLQDIKVKIEAVPYEDELNKCCYERIQQLIESDVIA